MTCPSPEVRHAISFVGQPNEKCVDEIERQAYEITRLTEQLRLALDRAVTAEELLAAAEKRIAELEREIKLWKSKCVMSAPCSDY